MAATGSNSTSRAYQYDVFLSFRGPDTRESFTRCLYNELVGNDVVVFRDSDYVTYGFNVAAYLQAVVKTSKIFVVVLSKDFASSGWCLREVEYAMELHKSTGTPEILPIFLDVTPDDVELKTALYTEALNDQRKKEGHDQVGRWEAALEMVGKVRGWEGQRQAHSEIITHVTRKILAMLKKAIVGIDEQVNEVMELLDIDSQDVRFIGIHGMGGIGKTTLTRIIFRKLRNHFKRCSFMDNVRELINKCGFIDLQKKLLRDIHYFGHVEDVKDVVEGKRFIQRACLEKVLVVLDDIDKNEQLENLISMPSSLGLGSRVLITTRDKGIFTAVDGIIAYEIKQLDRVQSLKLFSMHAFKAYHPPNDFYALSKQVVDKTGRLPLTLSIIGSHLYERNKQTWEETLHKLGTTPPNEVLDKLLISYNALSKDEKCIFLDIACFFINKNKARAMDVWEACNLSPRTAIEVLINKSFIKIHRAFEDYSDNDYIWMHDQLRDLGRNLVYEESPVEVEERSRLWNCEALDIVRSKKRKDKVEALVLGDWFNNKPILISDEEMENLPNLRFLELRVGTFDGDFKNYISKLKCICWYSPPPIYMPTNFDLKELVHFELSHCEVTEDWTGWNLLKVTNKIKVIILKKCIGLTKTPNFSGCLSLERLSFHECSKIQVVDSSIRRTEKLTSLFLGECERLRELPKCIGELISLEHLDLSHTKITELPDSIGHLKQLKVLRMNFCRIRKLTSIIGGLKNLEELHANYCRRLEGELPSEIGELLALRILCLSNTRICTVPSTIKLLTRLEELDLNYCKKLQGLPELPSNLNHLRVRSSSLQSVSNTSGGLSNLVELLFWSDSKEALMPTSNTTQTSLVQWIESSSKLVYLTLHLPPILVPPTKLGELACDSFNSKIGITWFSKFKCLTKLELSHFPLHEIQLTELEVLKHLKIQDCELLKKLSISLSLRKLEKFAVVECPLLVEIQILGQLKSLRDFFIEDCNSLQRIGDLSHCKKLNYVSIHICHGLEVIEGIDELEALDILSIWECGSLEKFINVKSTQVKDDCTIDIWECEKLLETGAGYQAITLARYRERVISHGKE